MDDTADAWLDKELAGCDLADERLNKRMRKLLAQVGGAMGQSIPLVCQDWAKTKATYRFFSNDRVNEADILAGHFLSIRDRMANHDGLESVAVSRDTPAPQKNSTRPTSRAVRSPSGNEGPSARNLKLWLSNRCVLLATLRGKSQASGLSRGYPSDPRLWSLSTMWSPFTPR
jgi:hypothetical protein